MKSKISLKSFSKHISKCAVVTNLEIMPISNKNLMQFHPTTVEDVRKEYDLDKPGMMDQAINILEEWIKKQEHFVKKDFNRDYLERVIISTKGSVERAKGRLDKICTLRTTAPELFSKVNVKEDLQDLSQWYLQVYMPILTKDHYRIYIIRITSNITSSIFLDAYRYNMIYGEHLKRNDYAKGIVVVVDLRGNNIMDLVSEVNIADTQNIATLYTEGFGFRIKNFFLISESKVINLVTNLLKQVLSDKIGERVEVLRTIDEVQNHIPKELLPEDFGGDQKSLQALYDEWMEELSSDDHVEYVKEMTKACTNESLRISDDYCVDQFGLPGSFKTLPQID